MFVRNLVFYSGVKTIDVIGDEQARNFLAQADRALMVAPATEIDRLEREHGVRCSGSRSCSTSMKPASACGPCCGRIRERDLTRVVLVANR